MELRDTVIGLIAETLTLQRTDVHDDSKLVDLAKDSILLFELLIQLEKTFNYRVKYEEIAHIETVGDVIVYISTLPINSAAILATEEHV